MDVKYLIFVFLGIAGMILNATEIYLTSKKWHALKPYDQLLLSLACSDLLVAALSITLGLHHMIANENIMYLVMLAATFSFTSINLLAIGFDRYMAIRHPIKHRNWLTRRRMKFFVCLCWFGVMMFVIILPAVLAMCGLTAGDWAYVYYVWIAKDWTVWFGSMMSTYYIIIIVKTLKRRAKLNCQSSSVETRATKREIALIWTCLFSFGFYIASAFPFAIYLMVCHVPTPWLGMLLLTNTIVNPMVYFFKSHREKKRRSEQDIGLTTTQDIEK